LARHYQFRRQTTGYFFSLATAAARSLKSGKGFASFLLDPGAANSGDPQRMFIKLRPSNEYDVIFTCLTTSALTEQIT
jgi:hypothetical protein